MTDAQELCAYIKSSYLWALLEANKQSETASAAKKKTRKKGLRRLKRWGDIWDSWKWGEDNFMDKKMRKGKILKDKAI